MSEQEKRVGFMNFNGRTSAGIEFVVSFGQEEANIESAQLRFRDAAGDYVFETVEVKDEAKLIEVLGQENVDRLYSRFLEKPVGNSLSGELRGNDLAYHESVLPDPKKGRILINEQEAVEVRYLGKFKPKEQEQSSLESVQLDFVDADGMVFESFDVDRAEAELLIGDTNLHSIEERHYLETNGALLELQGVMAGDTLQHFESKHHEFEVNSIEPGHIEPELDAQVRENAKKMAAHRQKMTSRQVNDAVEKEESQAVAEEGKSRKDRSKSGEGLDAKPIPDSVSKNFLQVKDKFYFKDQTIAFVDDGELLRARAEHKEVVKALVAIAEVRGWDQITVKGSKAFRQAVWFEAASRGIDARGYVPSDIDKAKLAELQKDGKAITENTIEKGVGKTPAQEAALDATPHEKNLAHGQGLDTQSHSEAKPSGALPDGVLRRVEGKVLEHGRARYQFNEKKSHSYFVRLDTPAGEQVVWGVDLDRAMKEAAPAKGDQVSLDYHGNKPVTVKEDVYDEKGKFVGTQDVDTHRNEWQVIVDRPVEREQTQAAAPATANAPGKEAVAPTKSSAPVDPRALDQAKTFATLPAQEGVAKHGELIGAYGFKKAAEEFAKTYLGGHSPETQAQFVAAVKSSMETAIQAGELPQAPKVNSEKLQQLKDPEKSKAATPATKPRSKAPARKKEKEIGKDLEMDR